MLTGYIDGVFKPSNTLTLPINSLGIERGYGAFETVRLYEKIPLDLMGHIDRLYNTCKAIQLPLTLPKEELATIFMKMVDLNHAQNYGVKILATQKGAQEATPYHIVLAPFVLPPLPAQPLKLLTTKKKRSFADHKTTAYLEGIVAEKEALKLGYDSILYIDDENALLEGLKSNLFGVKGSKIYTPSKGIVKGITRNILIKSINSAYTLHEAPIALHEVRNFDAFFLTSTLLEVFPIGQIDQTIYKNTDCVEHLKILFHHQKDRQLQSHLQTT